LGLLLHAIVHPADIQDRDGGILVMANLFGMFPFLKSCSPMRLSRPEFNQALARVRAPVSEAEIVKHSDPAKGFVSCPNAGSLSHLRLLNRCRRLAKDWETSIEKRSHSCASPQSASCSVSVRRDIESMNHLYS